MKVASSWPAALALLVTAAPLAGSAQAEVKFSGDTRVRYEYTDNQLPGFSPANDRQRMVARVRLGMTGKVNDMVSYGARLVTGDPDDPNSSDATLGGFVNDLVVSIDKVYLGLDYKGLSGVAGKFGNPLLYTDLVWDSDVNPQGVAATFARAMNSTFSGKAIGIFSIVDEQSNSMVRDSDMYGIQGQLSAKPSDGTVNSTVAAGYYEYHINSLASANGGDILNNTVVVDTIMGVPRPRYESDFELLDLNAVVDLNTSSVRFPVRLVGDYVKNFGTVSGTDDGFQVDAYVGPQKKQKDMRFRYGYSQVGKDAVLAAFSHDNTTLSTNYRQHTVTLDYLALENTFLNFTWYYYQFLDNRPAGLADEWTSRIRFNCELKF